MKYHSLLITLLAILSVQAAVVFGPTVTSDILGQFTVEEINDVKPSTRITFNIDEGKLSIAGCNQLGGSYTYDKATKKWKGDAYSITRKSCGQSQDQKII